jgi:2-aminoadipate transaminase
MKTFALSALARRTQEPPISWLMATALARPKLISLAAGFTDNETLPVREVHETLTELLGSPKIGQAALQYGTTAGDVPLRELTAGHLAALDGQAASQPAYSPEHTVITSGSQQLLYMSVEALCDPGDIVLVEDPTYFVFLGILQSHGVNARGIRMEKDGIDLAHLEEVLASLKQSGELRRVKMLYLVSYFQNPTGVTTSFKKKAGALELLRRYEKAAGHPLYFLEDGAYRELRFAGEELPSALAIKGYTNRVLYTGTYTKPFSTGARVGFGILPEPVFTAVLHIKGNHDFGSSNLLQQLLARGMASGRYEKHLEHLRCRYAHKAEIMRDAIHEHFPKAVEVWEPQGGLYFWARLPRSLKTGMKSKVFQTALAHDVVYVPGELCYAEDPTRPRPNHEMRLSYGAATEPNLRTGIARLGEVFQQLLAR